MDNIKETHVPQKIEEKIAELLRQGFKCIFNENGIVLVEYIPKHEISEKDNVTVVVPSEISSIYELAFSISKNDESETWHETPIKKIVIPSSIKYIEKGTFNCVGLEEIEFEQPANYKHNLGKIANSIKKITGNIESFELYSTRFQQLDLSFYGFNLRLTREDIAEILSPKYKGSISYIEGEFRISHEPKDIIRYLHYQNESTKQLMTTIIQNFPEDKIMANLISIYNEEIFLKNLELLKSLNNGSNIFFESMIAKIFINNINFFKYSIEECLIDNYTYLLSQTTISELELQELYFGTKFSPLLSEELNSGKKTKKEIIQKILIEYFKNNQSMDLPELFQTLVISPEEQNKLELIDRLTYVETMGLLASNSIEDRKNAIRMLKRTNYENIVEIDENEFSEETKSMYDSIIGEFEIFDAIRLPLYNKLNGINSSIFPLFVEQLKDNSKNSVMNKFLSSLTTIKKWNDFTDLKYRATCLKNEIVARILYGMLKKGDINGTADKETILTEIRKNYSSISDILIEMTGPSTDVFKEEDYITYMLEIDPYSFDAFRSFTDNPSDLECKYWICARENNYLFTKKETTRYSEEKQKVNTSGNEPNIELENSNEIKDIREYINNEIGMPKISEKNKEAYLRKVRELARSYIRKNTDEDLLTFLKSIDLYMRSSNEYTIQQNNEDKDKEITALFIFDKTSLIPKEDRLLYILYNLNKLAHHTTERHLLYDVHHCYRINHNEEENEKKVLKNLIEYISELMKYGLSYEDILIISEGKRNIDLKILRSNDSENNYLVNYLTDLCVEADILVPITETNINEIKRKFKYLNKNLYLNNRLTKVQNYAQERFTFFETKRIIADELIRKFTHDINGELIEIAFASTQEKQEFYAKNGIIVEIQSDQVNNQPVLVCYSEQFYETFSIHLKELNQNYLNKFNELFSTDPCTNKLVKSISHTALDTSPGLTLRSPKIRIKQDKSQLPHLEGGFLQTVQDSISFSQEKRSYAIAFYNFFTFDVERIKYQNKEKINSLKEILNKETLTPAEIESCRKALDELTNLKDSTYYMRFVTTEEELNKDYEKIFGYPLPNDIFGLESIQSELKLLYQTLLVNILNQKQTLQNSFRI